MVLKKVRKTKVVKDILSWTPGHLASLHNGNKGSSDQESGSNTKNDCYEHHKLCIKLFLVNR